MTLSVEKINEIRDADKSTLKSFINDSETIMAKARDKIEKEHHELLEQIQALHDEKGALLRSPMSKAELLEYAKESFKKEKDKTFSLITTHLSDCHKGHSTPFWELAMKHMFAEDKAYRLFYLILTEKDIKAMIDSLPEIGMPNAEREAKIKAIDDQIKIVVEKLDAYK